jgi:hypothetical protein
MPTPFEFDASTVKSGRENMEKELAAAMSERIRIEVEIQGASKHGKSKKSVSEELESEKSALTLAKKQRDDMELIERAFHPTDGIDSDRLRSKLETVKIDDFEFTFVDKLKNGTEKESFSVQRSDGTSLADLSSGQKIKFGLALSKLIAQLTGTTMKTVFIEGADVVDSIPVLAGFQMSIERVDKSLENLSVEIKKEF